MKFNISASSLNMYINSQLLFYYSYISKIPGTDWIPVCYGAAGNLDHEVLEQVENKTQEELEQLFWDLWYSKKYNKRVTSKGMYNKYLDPQKYLQAIIYGKKLFDVRYEMIKSEELINFPITNENSIKGYIDVVAKCKKTGDIVLMDWKTSSSVDTGDDFKRQGLMYCMLYWKKYNIIPKKIYFEYIKIKKQKEYSFTEKELSDFWDFCIDKLNKINTKGLDIKKYEIGDYDNPFNAHKTLCTKEKESRKEILKFGIASYGNSSFIVGDVTEFLKQGLDLKMSYEKDASKYIQQNNEWDGVVHLFNKHKNMFPTGYVPLVKSIIKQYADYMKKDFTIDYKDMRAVTPHIPMPGKLKGIIMRSHQSEAKGAYMPVQYGVAKMKTGMGKTIFAGEVIREVAMITLWVIDRKLLVTQTAESLSEVLGQEVGTITKGKIDIKGITVCTYQTLTKRFPELSKYLKSVGMLIVDECISGKSKIRLPDQTEITMEELYKDNSIKEVLSYNETEKIFEKKKIVKRMKTPMKEKWYSLKLEDELGDIHRLTLTDNHKIWTENGYKQVKNLRSNDILKVYLEPKKYKCKICKKIHDNIYTVGQCIFSHNPKYKEVLSNAGKKGSLSLKNKLKDKEYKKQYSERCKASHIKSQKKESYWINKKKMGEKRKGKNNPVFNNPDTIKKIKKTEYEFFHNLPIEKQKEQIKRFNLSKRIQPKNTKPELIIKSMNINNLYYNEDCKYMYKFKNNKWKIPDFQLLNENKVIEVSDFEYWRTKKERDIFIQQYKEIGIECLYLDAKDLKNNIKEVEDKIKKFCYNHKAKIKDIRIINNIKQKYKYNLEIDENHNYIANNILISNCHKASSNSIKQIAERCVNTRYRLGLSATPDLKEEWPEIKGMLGDICFQLDNDDERNKEFLSDVDIRFISLPDKEFASNGEYADDYESYIVNNDIRNDMIEELVNEHEGKNILIITKSLDHARLLSEKLGCACLIGETSDEERDSITKCFMSDTPFVCVGSVQIVSEGWDIPKLDGVIYATGMKSAIKTIQALGRPLRKAEGKDKAFYYDFCDINCRHFKNASRLRKQALELEGNKIKQ